MDVQILRAIVQSRGEVMKEVDDPEAFNESLMEDKFPLTDPAVLAALTRSFTSLISYKVSPEAYQRYSVRIQVIEVLRDWLRPSKELQSFGTFTHSERVLHFTTRILRIYLKNEVLFQDDGNIDVLVTLARALMCLLPRNESFLPDLEKLLERIASLRQTEGSEKLVLSAIKQKNSLKLGIRTVERLYVCQSAKLVEEPLLENLVDILRESKNTDDPSGSRGSCGIEELLEVAADSPMVFHVASSVLKEILVHLDYSTKVVDYVQLFLKSLVSRCQKRNKNAVDLYPLRLQSCVLLLNIEPEQHTSKSREYVLKTLETINSSSSEETLILLSHFPSWLEALSAHLNDTRNFTNMSVDDEL